MEGENAIYIWKRVNFIDNHLFSKLSSTHFILTIEITLTKLQIEVT